jgi:hypothetical protein
LSSRQLGQHIQGLDVVRVVIQHALQPGDVADGPQRETADLANAFRDGIGHGKKLLGMLIEQQMMTDENDPVIVGRI